MKSLGFKRYLNQQAMISTIYIISFTVYTVDFFKFTKGHLTFVHLISLTFSENGQTIESYAITKPQPEVEHAFIRCNQVDFLYEAS